MNKKSLYPKYRIIDGKLHMLAFRRYRRNPKTGEIEYPKKAKFFVMYLPLDEAA